ncbi:MAG TPA: HEAT repeat domain-containing protein, partial [Verrucomicrobiae bacterium]|nr:HEAT repeat domain-containing protein [Verrucomicrobiae bacterium]
AGAQLGRLVADRKNSGELRSEALRTLGELNDPALDDAVRAAAADPDEKLREAAIQFAAARPNASVLALLTSALENGTLGEKRAALTALGNLQTPQATAILLEQIEKLRNSTLPKELQLDLVEAANKHPAPDLQQALAQYQRSKPAGDDLAAFSEELYGGDAERGRKIFFEQADAQCVRCHKVDNRGGDVGPDLTHIGSQKDRHYLLESVVLPNKQIAPGFESVTVVLKNDEMIAGVLKSETADTLVINSPQNGLVTVKKSQIENRRKGLSPMPEGFGQILSKNALRDLVEFLSTQK